MKRINKIISYIIICSLFQLPIWAAESTTPKPYEKDEFPLFMKDLRRAEIITLGSMPFITFNVTLAYSLGKYADHNFDSDYVPNPFSKSSDSAYSTDEQIGIILTSLGISLGIGITDLIVRTVKRKSSRKKAGIQSGPVKITPISEDPEASRIRPPDRPEIESEEESVPSNKKEGRVLQVISEEKQHGAE